MPLDSKHAPSRSGGLFVHALRCTALLACTGAAGPVVALTLEQSRSTSFHQQDLLRSTQTLLQQKPAVGLTAALSRPTSVLSLSRDPGASLALLTTPYAAYRDGLLRRHITADGRLLSWVWLKEYEPGRDAADLAAHGRSTSWTQGARLDGGLTEAASISKRYVPWTRPVEGQSYAYGGDENPLLRGGLAMAALSLDYLVTGSLASLQGAEDLLAYAERSEFVGPDGVPSGFFLRTRWPGDRSVMFASGDELSGLIYGLFWLNRALQAAPADHQASAARLRALTSRLASQLQQHAYFIVPPQALQQQLPLEQQNQLQRGWAGLFALQWFAEEAFADITGSRYSTTVVKRALDEISGMSIAGDAQEDREMVRVLKRIGPEYSVFDRAIALVKLNGIILYQQGEPIRFKCSAAGITVKSLDQSIDSNYFNLTYMLHLAQVGLQRSKEGRVRSGEADELQQEMRRLTRGMIFADGSQTGFDADKFALAYVSSGLGHTVASGIFSLLDWIPGTGCSLQDKHVGSRQPDENYYVMAVAHAYDLMLGDSNTYFRTALPRRIDEIRTQFGKQPPLAERREGFYTPLSLRLLPSRVWWPQSFDRSGQEMRAGGGGPLLAFHDLDWHLGSGFSWENAPGAGRRPNGGANGDDGLCEGDLYSLWSTGIDAAREASGVDYLLPTALLAYRKGGAYQAEVRSGSRLAVPRLPVSAWTPARAWASGYDTPCQRTARKVPPNRQTATSTLGARLATGEALYKNQYLRSADGRHELILQRDGNLVLYRLYGSSARAAVWATGTSAGAMLVMQGDGNLVLYDSSVFNAQLPLHAVWASGTDGRPDAHLLLQSDGNAVLYRQAGEVTWATGTNER